MARPSSLGLIAAATGFTAQLALIAAVVLATDLFVGLTTLGRIMAAGEEELACLGGMNRIRYAYREMVPGVEPYFISSFHDDIASVLSGYSVDAAGGSRSDILHGLTTSPVMVGVVSSVVAGALASVVLLGLGFGLEVSLLGGVVGFGVTFGLGFWLGFRRAVRFGRARTPEFPAPTGDDDAVPGS